MSNNLFTSSSSERNSSCNFFNRSMLMVQRPEVYQEPTTIPSNNGHKSSPRYQQRVRFTLFLKILLTRLEKEGHHALLRRARETVSHCSKRNKMGDPDYAELVESLEVPLRKLVGEPHWIRAHNYMRYYIHDVAPRKRKNPATNSRGAAPRILECEV